MLKNVNNLCQKSSQVPPLYHIATAKIDFTIKKKTKFFRRKNPKVTLAKCIENRDFEKKLVQL